MTPGQSGQRGGPSLGVEATQPGAPASFVAQHREPRIAHPEWREDAALEDLPQRCAVETRDEKAEQVGRDAIVKAVARVIDQRQCGETANPLVWRQRVVDLRTKRLQRRGADRPTMEVAIGQS